MSQAETAPSPAVLSYPRFLRRALHVATEGSWAFYLWMTALTAVALVGANAWAVQVRDGQGRAGRGGLLCAQRT